MKAAFGLVSLLVALAIVALLVSRQRAVSVGAPGAPASAAASTEGNVREQSMRIQQQVQDDLQRALDQGQSRRDEADK